MPPAVENPRLGVKAVVHGDSVQMASTGSSTYPRLVDLPTASEDRYLALDCARLIAPDGPIPLPNVAHHRHADLSRDLLRRISPTAVVVPLFAGDQDALGVVETLEELGFAGRILVIAPALPRPALVERELRAAGPGTRLMLVSP